MKVILTSEYLGQTVHNFQGAEVGRVVDFVFDEETANLSFAVLSREELEYPGEPLLIVPWQALTVESDGRGLKLGINQDRLKRAPAIERSELHTLSEKQVRNWVLSYFGFGATRRATPEEERLLGRAEPGRTKAGPDGDALARMLALAANSENQEEELPDEDLEEQPADSFDEDEWQEAA